MRLIDADALREEHCEGCANSVQDGCKTDPVCGSLLWVHDAPTIDAVSVVRCKDCVHAKNNYLVNGLCLCEKPIYCMGKGEITRNELMAEDDFCSYGEKRDE